MWTGVAVVVALLLGFMVWRRQSEDTKNDPKKGKGRKSSGGDAEGGGGDGHSNALAPYSGGGQSRALVVRGSSERSGRSRSSGSGRPFSSETSAYHSSSENRGRSRTSPGVYKGGPERNGSRGPQMISRLSSRSWHTGDEDGPRMYSSTPTETVNSQNGPQMYNPHHHDDLDPPGSRGSQGARMFSSSPGVSTQSGAESYAISPFTSTPGAKSRDEPGNRRLYTTTPPRTGHDERVRVTSRKMASGRENLPRRYAREEGYGEDGMPPLPKPQRRQRSHSPSGVYSRSRHVERYSRSSSPPRDPWERETGRRREGPVMRMRGPDDWVDGEPHLLRRPHSARVGAMRRARADDAANGAPTYEEYRRSLHAGSHRRWHTTSDAQLVVGSPTRNRGRRSGLVSGGPDDLGLASRVSREDRAFTARRSARRCWDGHVQGEAWIGKVGVR